MATRAPVRYATWMLPAASRAPRLAALLDALATQHDGEPFEPHLTLTSGLVGNEDAVIERWHRLVRPLPPFVAPLGKVGFADERFRAVYVTSAPVISMRRARARVRSAFGLGPARFQPHLSLLYARPEAVDLAAVAASVADLPWPDLPIERMSLWRITDDPATWAPVAEQRLEGLV